MNEIDNKYLDWMIDIVYQERYPDQISFKKLLICLNNIEFRYSIPRDSNRAQDGLGLRYRFALSKDDRYLSNYLLGPCSVLEMILALAIRCEENIMDDPSKGNRTGQWFWGMIVNLGLGSMTDDRFDESFVHYTITRFLNREYAPDGRGGLFTINNCKYDLREVEIWYQLNWYLDTFV